MAIGYLPAPLVGLNFRNIIARASTQKLIVRHLELQEFIQYLHENYISREATFPVPLWNVFRRDNDTRANNHVEGLYFIEKTLTLKKVYFVATTEDSDAVQNVGFSTEECTMASIAVNFEADNN
ncbi:hypothetical protein HOLleu_01856 [Holothuria leucospilota]|uniref:Uncharacterized protein n=1 Tax=Holothuria leucospilota TaxID=206669 RepID=A0A9Q1CPW5_HOLLE|nr:hypothetical protein HOLleu_01856 [Holothuria leucospilota]